MDNPFNFGTLAEKENFIDRVDDRKIIKSYLTSGLNIILMSPRRLGKSSLIRQCSAEILEERKDIRICHIDAFPIKSINQFYKKFTESIIKATTSSWEQWIEDTKEFVKSIVPKISLGIDPANEFSLSFDFKSKDDENYKTDLLNLPERIAQKKQLKIIICIDEFQKLAELSGFDELEQNMRSVWQLHSNCTYCLYGSNRHMMEKIFNSSEKPFYKFGQVYHLGKIANSDWADYIVRMFTKTNKVISNDLAEQLANKVCNHSYYVQQFASSTWYYTDNEVTNEILDKAYALILENNSENYYNVYNSLTAAQVNLLLAIHNKEPQLYSTKLFENYELGTVGLIKKNKEALMRKDLIMTLKGELVFIDPLFEDWFVSMINQ